MREVRTVTMPRLAGSETAKSLLGARTKQMIGLTLSQDSVKSSSLDPDSNIADRQMIA